jgi:uncharacterized protein with HEPN domain
MPEAPTHETREAREWRFYLDDMITRAEKVIVYTEGLDQARFTGSGLNYDATLRNLELIGEAATHIPGEVRTANPLIPWRQIIATRNRLIHGYLGIDDIPGPLPALQSLRDENT